MTPPDSTTGVSLRPAELRLVERAADYLVSGPATACDLIAHVCQLAGPPARVADHMAAALLGNSPRFERHADGRWSLREATAMYVATPVTMSGLHDVTYAVVDVETTGSSAAWGDRITEVAVVEVRNGSATTIFETLVNPERAIPPRVSQLTHITAEMVRHAPTFGEVCDQLLGALHGRVFVAHNATFDWRFISYEVHRATGRSLDGKRLCTVRMARRLIPQLRRRSLDAVTWHYGIPITGRHRAGGDAVATAEVLIRLLREANDRGCNSFEELEQFVRMPGTKKKRKRRPPAMPGSAGGDEAV